MNRSDPDWTLWRSFAAVAEHGSLSAAARATGVSQPTLGRHIDALEVRLGLKLFDRSLSGFAPTEWGLRAYEPVRAAAARLAEAALVSAGANATLKGTVRLTASEVTSHFTLPPILARLRVEFPEIALELVPSDSVENILMREADIAVRMFRPTQLDLVTRKLGESPIVPCAHERYLVRRGRPERIEELRGHDLVGFDRSDLLVKASAQLGYPLMREDFAIRCDNQSAGWLLIASGGGIGFAQRQLVARTPGMVELDLPLAIPPLEVWLTTHRELFTARRIRAVYDRLAVLVSDWLKGKPDPS